MLARPTSPACIASAAVLLVFLSGYLTLSWEVRDVTNSMTSLSYQLDRELAVVHDLLDNSPLPVAKTGLSRAGLTPAQIRAKRAAHRKQLGKQVVSYSTSSKPFWQVNWQPSYACTTHVRVGGTGDGGKWMCDPEFYLGVPGCVVYSFGSNGDFSFEEGVHALAPHCEIHTVDSGPPTGNVPEFVTYHQGTIGGVDDRQAGQFTPVSLMRILGHTNVTVLKMDCEGCEFGAFSPSAFPANGRAIQQVLFEVHYWGVSPIQIHNLFRTVTKLGYAIFSKEPNLDTDGCCVEFSVVYLPRQLEVLDQARD